MIEVGTMAGTGKTAQAAAPFVHGVPEAVDDGAFRESLTASVRGAVVARGAVPVAVSANKLVSASVAAATGVRAALVSVAIPLRAAAIGETAGSPAKIAVEGSRAQGSAVKVESGDSEVAVPTQVPAVTGRGAVAAVEAAPLAKAIAGADEAAPVSGNKALKVDAGATGKKVAAKSAEAAVSGAAASTGLVSAALETSGSVPVAGVQAIAIAAVPVAAAMAEAQVQAPAGAVAGGGKAAKVGAASGLGKGTGPKKIESAVQGAGKDGPAVAAAVGGPAAGGGAGHGAVKDGAAGTVAQGGVGTAAVAPVSAVAIHAGVVGSAGVKVGASVEAVSTAAGQGAATVPEVKTLAATPNLLEVGIDGGTHGWLRVRAELGQSGEVTASMVAGSASQADTLRRELSAMSTYLAGESVGVSSLVVNAAGAAAGAQDAAMSLGTGAQGSGGDGRAPQGSVGAQGGGTDGGGRGSLEESAGLEFGGAELPAAMYANGSGNWLSVRV